MRTLSMALACGALCAAAVPAQAASVSFSIDLTLRQVMVPGVDPDPGLTGTFSDAATFSIDEGLLLGAESRTVGFEELENFSLSLPSFFVTPEVFAAGDCSVDEAAPTCGIAFSGADPLGVVGFFRTPTSDPTRFVELANLGLDPLDPAGLQSVVIARPLLPGIFDTIAAGNVSIRRTSEPMPEPSSIAVLGVSAALAALVCRRRRGERARIAPPR